MDLVNSFTEKVQTSQPFLTKKGLELQRKNDNHTSGVEKVSTQETVLPSQTYLGYAIDIKV